VNPRLFLHIGLPRTGTTALQAEVFPPLRGFHYLGKNSDNGILPLGKVNALDFARRTAERYREGDNAAAVSLRQFFSSITRAIKSNTIHNRGNERMLTGVWMACVSEAARVLKDKPLLYSDESLSEGVSGVIANLRYGDGVFLEQLREHLPSKNVRLSVVLREPLEFLTASYYKAMELVHRAGMPALSFDTYIANQLKIYERHASASRVFLCMHRTAIRHFRSICPDVVTTDYRDLLASGHVVDTLLGVTTGEKSVSFSQLPRENSSWRSSEINQFILGAEGVPHAVSLEDYRATFAESLGRHGLIAVFRQESRIHMGPASEG
jgi:hypothetical protein